MEDVISPPPFFSFFLEIKSARNRVRRKSLDYFFSWISQDHACKELLGLLQHIRIYF